MLKFKTVIQNRQQIGKRYISKKLKEQYRNNDISIENIDPESGLVLRNICQNNTTRSNQHKAFSTKQERSMYLMHHIEYTKQYGKILRCSRSNSYLPDEYDDLPTSVHHFAKSWKHNSNRKKQYYK